jgi:DNA-binding response OmpR family regulator
MTKQPKIIIVEDDAEIAGLYAKEIEMRGIARVEVLVDPEEI